MFADDIKIFYTHSGDGSPLQSDLNRFVNWCNINGMHLNLDKCKQMNFSRTAGPVQNYFVGNVSLELVESMKDLGVTFDSKLRFHLHIERMVNKATCVLGFIKRWAKEFNDPYATKLLYTVLVRPILEYASVVWSPQYQSYMVLIESVQKQFLLFCLRGLNWDPNLRLPSYESRLKLIDLPTLHSRRTMLNACFVLNILNGTVKSSYLLNAISINVPSRPSRYPRFLKLQYFRGNYLNFNPLRIAFNDFNFLYNHIDFHSSTFSIKKSILTFLN